MALEPRLQRSHELGLVGLEGRRMGRVERGKIRRQRLGDGRHRLRVVPQVRVRRAVRQTQQMLHVDHLASRVRRRRGKGVHEGVVADPVLDQQVRLGDLLAHARRGLIGMGISVRVRVHRVHAHVLAADLRRHVAVLVLPRHHRHRARCRSPRQASDDEPHPAAISTAPSPTIPAATFANLNIVLRSSMSSSASPTRSLPTLFQARGETSTAGACLDRFQITVDRIWNDCKYTGEPSSSIHGLLLI